MRGSEGEQQERRRSFPACAAVIWFVLATCEVTGATSATDGWGFEGKLDAETWSDRAEVKPAVTDGWDIVEIASKNAADILLRDGSGAMVRWVTMSQMEMLNTVRRRIERVSEIKTDFYVVRGDKPNASAGILKGRNSVMVNFGMLELLQEDDDAWAALLGHEIGHLKLAHGKKRGKRNIPLSILKGAVGAVSGDPITSLASSLMIDGIGAGFSRKEESTSDYLGVIWATQAGYDPFGGVRVQEKMLKKAGLKIPFLSTHPSNKKRVKELRDLAQRIGKDSPDGASLGA
jgi:hypothetical protein